MKFYKFGKNIAKEKPNDHFFYIPEGTIIASTKLWLLQTFYKIVLK